MRNRGLLHIALALAVFAAFSCKKDEEKTETKPSLYGVDFQLPTFARPGDSFLLKPSGISTGDGKALPEKIEYKWKVNTDEYSDPMDTYTLNLPEVGNYTVYCQAYDPSETYYSAVTDKLVIVIDPAVGKTLTGTGIDIDDEHITDPRDKKDENLYFYIRKGDVEWFRNNLAWTGAGVAYEDSDVTSYPLGRYYTWEEAMEACPEGWRLPTDEEWDALGTDAGALTANAYLNGRQMWEYWPDVTRTNESEMALIPAGYVLVGAESPTFKRIYSYAAFWTATESETDPSKARYRYIYVEDDDVKATWGDKASLALSVRCVR